jgi:prepilin-type N-terminal cleavage/methylation domain-containing protein
MGHKGFTLVEVIVSLAIMTIVGGAISAFLIAGNNSYIRGNKDLTLQEETQLTTNQMIDLIIDVQNDIRFETLTGEQIDSAGNIVAGSDTDIKELILYNDESVIALRWQGGLGDNANEVYLLETDNTWVDDDGNEVPEGTEGAKLKPGDISATSASVTRSLLAQYVTDFDVDLSELDKRKVKLNLTFDVDGKTYTVSETIKLRNSFGKSSTEEYYWITGIEITPTPVTLTQGEVGQFTCTMTGDPGAIEQGVTWSWRRVDGKTSDSNTSFSYGDMSSKLSLSFDEPIGGNGGEGTANAAIEITATSVADPTQQASAWVSVKEPDITAIYIVPGQTTQMQGDQNVEFECIIEGIPEVVEKGVKEWTVEANGKELSADTTITAIGDKKMKATLNIGMDQSTGINVIKITAQSAAVSTSEGRAEAYVSVNKYSNIAGIYDVKLIATNLSYYELDASGTLGYMATIECLPSYADYANGYPIIKWEETTLGEQAYKLVDDPTEVDVYTGYKTPNYVTNLYCGTQSNTHAHVQATVQLDAENSMVVGIDITIPANEKAVKKDSIYIDSDNFVLYRGGAVNLTLKGISDDIKDSQITWEVSNLDEYSDLKNIATLGGGSSYKGSVNAVGFGEVSGAYMGDNGNNEYYLYPTGTGINTVINANSLKVISLSNEYRLNVVAKIDGEEVASTNVLLPRFDFTFPNGKRYMVIDAPSYHTTPEGRIPIYVYGIAPNSKIGLSDKLSITWTAEKAFDGNSWLANPSYYRVGTDRFDLSFQIGAYEQNDMIIITIIDPSIGEDSRRNLVFYVNHVGKY